MAQAISGMLPSIRLKAPGCPEPLIKDTLYDILREFFWDSEVWKYTADNGLDYTLNQQTMNLPVAGTDIPANTAVKRIDTVLFDSAGSDWDTPVPFKTRDQLDRYDKDWWTETGTEPTYWTYHNGVPIVYPIASATVTDGLLIRAVIAPNYSAVTSTLPDLIYFEFNRYIIDGVLAELKEMPGKDWTDLAGAARHARRYKEGIDMAKSRAEADFGQPDREMSYGGI
jgi:hypothetical protein